MVKIHIAETSSQIIVPMDCITAFKSELERQGIPVTRILRPRNMRSDPAIDMETINRIMDINYGRYGKTFTGPVMVIANGNYDDMLAFARQLVRGTTPSPISAPMDADEMKEIETALRRKEG